MICNPGHHRRSIRLKDYDYSQAGAYFITVCTYNRGCLFGDVVNGEMQLNDCGRVVEREWVNTANIRKNIELGVYVVMPNHFHGIMILRRGIARYAPTSGRFGKMAPGSLSAIVRSFKSAATRRINGLRGTPGTPVWQRNYYEHILRNGAELNEIREYVANNPLKWELDSENPERARHAVPLRNHGHDPHPAHR